VVLCLAPSDAGLAHASATGATTCLTP